MCQYSTHPLLKTRPKYLHTVTGVGTSASRVKPALVWLLSWLLAWRPRLVMTLDNIVTWARPSFWEIEL
jgi:hypothetical protein